MKRIIYILVFLLIPAIAYAYVVGTPSNMVPGNWQAFAVDPGAPDSGVTSTAHVTLKNLVTAIGTTKKSTIVFPHTGSGTTTQYTIGTALDLSSYSNITFQIENGAQLKVSTGVSGVTLPSPANVIAQPNQQIMSGTSLYFSTPGTVYPQWWYSGSGYWTTAIQSAINSITKNALYSGVVYFPSILTPYYLIDDEITITSKKNLILKGEGRSQIKQDTVGKSAFVLTSCTYIAFEDLLLNSSAIATVNGVSLNGCSEVKFNRCYITNFGGDGIGMISNHSVEVSVTECYFVDNADCAIDAVVAAKQANGWRIQNCTFQNSDYVDESTAVKINGVGIVFTGNVFTGNKYGIRLPGDAVTLHPKAVTIDGNYFEAVTYPIYISETAIVYNVGIHGNFFNQASASRATHTSILGGANKCQEFDISNNTFIGAPTSKDINFPWLVYSRIQLIDLTDVSLPVLGQDFNVIEVGGSVSKNLVESTLIGNTTFTAQMGNYLMLDPNGANRNVNPSGNFPNGFEITIYNSGTTDSLIFDSTDTNFTITPKFKCTFLYNTAGWRVISAFNITETLISTGTGAINMGSASGATNAGFIELQPGKFVPYWTDATP